MPNLRSVPTDVARDDVFPPGRMFAESAAMRRALALATAVARRDTTVLLLGETGTGKGELARYIHRHSSRAAGPFVALNCAGLQRTLTESELFGYERGAFTGAAGKKIGLLEAAHGGTLFLDEIGEMEPSVQAKLLKVLEDRRFRRIGGVTEVDVDVRIICATHRELDQDVADGRFRRDLFYRISVFGIRLPALRERPDEILPLAHRFLAELQDDGANLELSAAAIALLRAHPWPGNVRELRNAMERAAILCPSGSQVAPEHLPPLSHGTASDAPSVSCDDADAVPTLQNVEKDLLERALADSNGNIKAAAKALGVSRGTLYRKIEKYGIGTVR